LRVHVDGERAEQGPEARKKIEPGCFHFDVALRGVVAGV
jgi:hypothetical protein